jgi:hypothetical protein
MRIESLKLLTINQNLYINREHKALEQMNRWWGGVEPMRCNVHEEDEDEDLDRELQEIFQHGKNIKRFKHIRKVMEIEPLALFEDKQSEIKKRIVRRKLTGVEWNAVF